MSKELALAAESPAALAYEVKRMVAPDNAATSDLLETAMRAWSRNTLRAFRSDLALWLSWCKSCTVPPADATPDLVAAYIRALSGSEQSSLKRRRPATIERYLVNIGWAYRMLELRDPTSGSLVSLERRAMKKALGVRQKQARAIRYKGDISDLNSPASGICLTHLLAAVRRDLMGKRDAALLRLAYDTGCRRSELVAVRCAHIEGPDRDGAGALFIPSSKTDAHGEGEYAYIAPATMAALKAWLKDAGIREGPVFRRVMTHFDRSIDRIGEDALHPNSVTLIYRQLAKRAFERGLFGSMSRERFQREVSTISSHSIRVGVAQDNFAAGEALPAIMQSYRWRDARTVMRYGAKLATKSGASARMSNRFSEQ